MRFTTRKPHGLIAWSAFAISLAMPLVRALLGIAAGPMTVIPQAIGLYVGICVGLIPEWRDYRCRKLRLQALDKEIEEMREAGRHFGHRLN